MSVSPAVCPSAVCKLSSLKNIFFYKTSSFKEIFIVFLIFKNKPTDRRTEVKEVTLPIQIIINYFSFRPRVRGQGRRPRLQLYRKLAGRTKQLLPCHQPAGEPHHLSRRLYFSFQNITLWLIFHCSLFF